MRAASTEVGFSYASAKAKEAGLRNNSGFTITKNRDEDKLPTAIPLEDLKPEAARALNDFAYFRRRYLGRISTPWQEEAGYRVIEFMDTKRKEYVVINCPPGSGKSTLFTLDIPAWVTCRNRAVRGMIGSASQTLAERYLVNLRNVLESPFPFQAEPDLIDKGLAVDAIAVLAEDFGAFKPENSQTVWSNKALVVAQFGNRPISHKEPTWSAYGLDSTLIGGRYGLIVWDDIIDESDCLTLERIEKWQRRWDKVHEKRLEPMGAIIMPGQRLSPDDIYRYCLDKGAGSSEERNHDECCSASAGKKYHHIVYRAHWEDRCVGAHDNATDYYPNGCLLDPHRLPWIELETEQQNNIGNFMQIYQQEDADPSQLLVNPIWVAGGTDPHSGEVFMGCWDNERDLFERPPGLTKYLSIATTDPSPTKMWANQFWAVDLPTEFQYLIGLENRAMKVGDFLTEKNGVYSGLMEEWWQISNEIGIPIRFWIIEAVAAQKFLLEIPYVMEWSKRRSVTLINHQTHRGNKPDPKYGPQVLANVYRHGKVRLPGRQLTRARFTSLKLVDQVTKWPRGAYDDQVMAQWFLNWRLPRLAKVELADTGGHLWTPPSWAKTG